MELGGRMSYLDQVLQDDEEVIAMGRMHWVVYVRGLVLLAVGALVMALRFVDGPAEIIFDMVALLVLFYGFAELVRMWIEKWTTEIAVTDRRVIHKRGLIRRETGEMNMDKVESVVVDQTILGRLLGYGSIVVRGTGAGIEGLHHIADPLRLRSAIVVG